MQLASEYQNDRLKLLAVAGGWVVLFLVGVFAYWPGLKGPFLLDDYGSIVEIGYLGGVRDWSTFKAFVFGGHAGPTGRPLALLSFLIDANNWPTDPWPFKRTNLVIHLINGALLGVLIGKVLRLLQFSRQESRWIALVSAACWLLHPFLVSTTLYAVQRMAQLSTLFVLCGLVSYLYGRSLVTTNTAKAYLIMSVSVGLFTFLAVMSKENGVLLPLLIGVIEITVLASQQQRVASLNRYWAFAFIVMPSIVVGLYLGTQFFKVDFLEAHPPRDYSIYERLLTQPRVLSDYLKHWFIPSLYTSGVFQDHVIKSTGLFSPLTTFFAALFHVAVITVAFLKRRKWPLVSLAALFFYGSHLLESSVINLELYYEHRNYLAASFLFVPLIVIAWRKLDRHLFFAVAVGLALLLGGFTRYSATVWESFPSIVEASARKAPTSARAQAQYAVQLFNAQRYDESLQVIDAAIENIPGDNTLLLVNRLIILCNLGILEADDFQRVADLVSGQYYDSRSIKPYTALASAVVNGRCPDVSISALKAMFVNMLSAPSNADPNSIQYSQIQYFVGFVSVHADELTDAVTAFRESLSARPGASRAMVMAAHLATGGYFVEALEFSNLALSQLDTEPQGVLRGARVYESDIKAFQATVRSDMAEQQAVDTPDPAP